MKWTPAQRQEIAKAFAMVQLDSLKISAHNVSKEALDHATKSTIHAMNDLREVLGLEPIVTIKIIHEEVPRWQE